MRNKIIAFLAVFALAGCMPTGSKSPKFTLNFSFEVKQKLKIQPSYQTVMWLEKPNGDFVKTLYISDYLSYGGYNDPYTCPIWSAKANWAQTPRTQADAITGATPMIGERNYKFKFSKKKLIPGRYKYFIEVHLAENYNELYSGELDIPCNETESEAQVTYLPKKHPMAGDILSHVIVNCK